MDYGREVMRLADAWHQDAERRLYYASVFLSDADARRDAYLAEREASYRRLCDAYAKANQPCPPRQRLSGR